MLEVYFNKVKEILQSVEEHETEKMAEAAGKVAASILNGGIIQLFGCGHSHLLTEEVFYRAGGLVPVKPILIEPLMLHEGALTSSRLERQNGYAADFLTEQDFRDGDVVFVVSTSGRNPVPVDVALKAREKGAFIIALTSMNYAKSQASRHIDDRYLYDSADLVIDNHSLAGDAVLHSANVDVPFGPTSTVIGAAIVNAIFSEAIQLMADQGFQPPVFLSGNLDGADEHNKRLIEKYRDRISLLS
ncbi:SIS domain-containing protein [Planococcus lenghuensis]|uniref:UPF0309 protein B0X71_18815 n=1 Tax=Planococcus lenghuensis TaxID=2213202 RepID=A0A1Q2L566_9BACL|nr:SIS domain-containing protein [Planococcus lenghuensis]AQQ55237.1 hypothetical protein B0X71_18815 [Planococcus lenghuensis]